MKTYERVFPIPAHDTKADNDVAESINIPPGESVPRKRARYR